MEGIALGLLIFAGSGIARIGWEFGGWLCKWEK